MASWLTDSILPWLACLPVTSLPSLAPHNLLLGKPLMQPLPRIDLLLLLLLIGFKEGEGDGGEGDACLSYYQFMLREVLNQALHSEVKPHVIVSREGNSLKVSKQSLLKRVQSGKNDGVELKEICQAIDAGFVVRCSILLCAGAEG